jgi:hypothetical protein
MNFTIDISTVIFSLLLLVVLGLLYYTYILNKKLEKFLIGKSSTNLDDSISFIKNSLADREKFQKDMEEYLLTVEKRLKKSVQSVSTVRFNPFKGTGSGSNQSFSTTFLNEERDGVIISSLYSREHISVYSKPVMKGASEYELSDEEKESLDKAKAVLTESK